MFIRVELKTMFCALYALVIMAVFYNVKRLGTKHECATANELNESNISIVDEDQRQTTWNKRFVKMQK